MRPHASAVAGGVAAPSPSAEWNEARHGRELDPAAGGRRRGRLGVQPAGRAVAAAEAARRLLPLRLVAAHAWPSGGMIGDPGLGVDGRAMLRDVVLGRLAVARAAALQVASGLEVEHVEVTGYPEALLRAESARAEMVVLGDRGLGGFTGQLIGSVAVAVTASGACPVVVVRGPEPDFAAPLPEPVVVGVDGSSDHPASRSASTCPVEVVRPAGGDERRAPG